ncbi:hypothetical protein A4H97_27025 [Niastella yeongjuensis]|uniref:Adhesin domain-containing protein n=1 Tax=Niastella yeongjuensis TaxID=354355 RepID=A0A1V9F0H9_9BACT|nr:hypothetical protein [Niastella yeongjuensis]OQP51858.1 hypothetical protein A4H97_27025 [Niastella yeongjuensis]SEP44209.1 hypothetical protein SAMN05660816_06169 [Niastella yeongjuensis]
MKVTLKRYRLPLFISLLLLTTQVFAGEPLVEKKKTYNKSYSVSNSDKISLTNQFGEMKINTWDKNEVSVSVTITAEANTDERAQAILDVISIEDGKNADGVFFKTKINNKNNKDQQWSKGEKQGFHIDYVVNMPARNPLQAKNEFGPMTIGDYNGEVTLESKFGSLTTGKLNNVKKVSIEFGKGTIGSISNGSLVIKFSKAAIDNLDGSVNAVFEYCDVAKLRVDNSTKALTVKNSFSNLYLDLNTNISANFDISTNFGDLHNKTNFDIKEEGADDDDRHGPRFNKRYQGKAGSGNTDMKIKSEYGQITLGHNLTIDMNKEKNKDKNKDKDKKGTVRI